MIIINIIRDSYFYKTPILSTDIQIKAGNLSILKFLSSDFTASFIPVLLSDYRIFLIEISIIDFNSLFLFSLSHFDYIFPHCPAASRIDLYFALNLTLSKYHILEPLQIAAFLSLIASAIRYDLSIEDSFSSAASDNDNVSLGNHSGTNYGIIYRHRGVFKIKGWYLYSEMTNITSLDLINIPNLVNSAILANIEIAGYIWKKNEWNKYITDKWADLKELYKKVNNSYTDLEFFMTFWLRSVEVLSNEIKY